MKTKSIFRFYLLILLLLMNYIDASQLQQRLQSIDNDSVLQAQRQRVQEKTNQTRNSNGNIANVNSPWSIGPYLQEINDHLSWEDIKQTMHDQKDVILY